MTDTYTEDTTPDSAPDSGTSPADAKAEMLAASLKRLTELRGFYAQAVSELEAGRASGRDRVAALQAEVDAENSSLVDVVADAATEFNDESSKLFETGFATPKALAGMGLGMIRVPKRS